ncbi:MAG: phosphatidate cytidylyltransferase [Novosphingobium sp.]
MTEAAPKKSDLKVRALSAVVMVAVAGTALWLGGWFWSAFIAAVSLGVLWEWWSLVRKFRTNGLALVIWMIAGFAYVGLAAFAGLATRLSPDGIFHVSIPLLAVIGTDVGAYFVGRSIGGPKIAATISPSKTWSGLAGGIVGATMGTLLMFYLAWRFANYSASAELANINQMRTEFDVPWLLIAVMGFAYAVTAQVGDFFESWMKRRAGVKDSSQLIPGHGGLFDRADGMLAVLCATALFAISARMIG